MKLIEHRRIVRETKKDLRNEIKELKKQIKMFKGLGYRKNILERDNHCCRLCKNDEKELLEVHHLTSRFDGGDNSISNLISVCPSCHLFLHCNPKTIMEQKRKLSEINRKCSKGNGRPKGSKDKRKRRITGYHDRYV